MEHKKYYFEKLTPVNDIDISVYEEAIDYIFDNADITNVAISGSYSAGKSSVIDTYKEKHKEYKFMHISLAHFETPNKDDGEIKESVLEGKILNQLIHQIPSEKIPQTNFRVKKDTGKSRIFLMALVLCLLIGSVAFLLLSNKISSFVGALPENVVKNVLTVVTGEYATIVVVLILVVSSVICIYNVVKIQHNKNIFHKVSVQGNTIEIFEKQDESYFDKYLNEVLYLFEQVDADVIVFEDMDRFNANSIFERLREVNHLTNTQRRTLFANKKGQYKPLRFFYLLRDDIFTTKDRTKFFDYIIPIVPVLDGSNSYEQFIRHLRKGNIFEKFETSFLQRLSLYIDDMRVLKNVYNEFVIYMNRLDNTDLNWNKMLALIVYKNLFPRDFSNLQLGKGYVHELFEQKDNLRREVIKQLEEDKQLVTEHIDRINNEILNDTQELEDAYEAKYEKLPRDYYGRITQEGQNRKNELENEKKLRKKAIEDRANAKLPSYEKEVADIEQKITLVKTQLLAELITRKNAESVFMISSINPIGQEQNFNEIKGSDYFELLKFLIRSGYIDETYCDYMTYFYEESLSANDKTFLRRITDKRGADFEYSLQEVQKVIISPVLRVVDFGEEETLNFELLSGLLVNQGLPNCQMYLKALIDQLKTDNRIDFVTKYYDSDKFVNTFIVKLNEQWPEFFSYVVSNKKMSIEQIRKYSIDTLCLSDGETISQVNFDNSLSDYISEQEDYLSIQGVDVDDVISKFDVLQVSFQAINYEKSNKELFDKVYEHDLYDLTFNNIEMMLRSQHEVTSSYDIKHKNYTIIKEVGASPLAEYVDLNLKSYLEEIILNCGEKIEDVESAALSILNNSSVDEEIKEKYIAFLSSTIDDITKVDNQSLWKVLIVNGIVKMSVSNVICYFQKHGLTLELVVFINGMNLNTDYTSVQEEFGVEVAEKFFDSVAISNEIETAKYQKVLTDMGYYFDTYDAKEIEDEKIRVLIDNQIIEMNEMGLDFIRNNYEGHCMHFIELNVKEYVEIQTEDIFNYDEAVKVLEFSCDDELKIKLLGFTSDPISVLDKELSNEVLEYILEHNFDCADKEYLCQHYSQYHESVRALILKKAVCDINNIINDSIVIEDNLLSDILTKSKLSQTIKIKVWAKSIPMLNEETCKKHFDELGVSELKGIFTKRNTTTRSYIKTDEVTAILSELKKNAWIHDYYETDEKESYIVMKYPPKTDK
nr:hypothetical protein [Eubacterium sp.]